MLIRLGLKHWELNLPTIIYDENLPINLQRDFNENLETHPRTFR